MSVRTHVKRVEQRWGTAAAASAPSSAAALFSVSRALIPFAMELRTLNRVMHLARIVSLEFDAAGFKGAEASEHVRQCHP
jgi:hypothetical protein